MIKATSVALAIVIAPRLAAAQAIGGIAIDQRTSAPLAGVRTFAVGLGADSTATTTAPDGSFVLALPRAGRYVVHFVLDEFTEHVSDSLDVKPDDFLQREFRLVRFERPKTAAQVEKPVVPLPPSRPLRYPAALRGRGIGGTVIARFIIDSTGRVRPGSFRAVSATDPRFVPAVREAMPWLRFEPAEIDGRKVQQLVERPFYFEPERERASP